ncbi:threonine/homoserine efflux transporter RhtA [Tumebacillus sp. BK434]|nr:threonine/homoserine efflux transporter RhtA [Tumebacillus sp. BK434]
MPILAVFAHEGGANVATTLFLRFALAGVFFYLCLRWNKNFQVSISKKQWVALFLCGGVIYALVSTLYFASLNYISGSLATLMLYTYPIFVVILSILLEKEVFPRKVIWSILLAFAGMCLVIGASFGAINTAGVLLAIGSAVGYAIHIVLMNRVVKQLPAFLTTGIVILFTALVQLIIGLSTGSLDFHLNTLAWASIFGLTAASTILALLTFFAGLQLVGSTNASMLSMLEPILTILLSVIILKESFTLLQVLGTAIVLCGAFIVVRNESTKREIASS